MKSIFKYILITLLPLLFCTGCNKESELSPEGELARLAVRPDVQNRGLARIMLQFGMDELKRRG